MSRGASGNAARVLLACLLALLAACGSSRVIRETTQPAPVRVSQPRYGASAIVRKGDTLYRIATSNGISALDLAMWNGIRAPYTIYPGQRLHLYPRTTTSTAASRAPAARPVTRRPVATRPAQPAPGATRPPAGTVRPAARPPVATPTPPPPAPVITSTIAWRWPADGSLLNRYVDGDPTRQGIDIAGVAGAPVRAAGDGVVVYSGAGLVGYGELIIIKHDDAWLSAYGHNRSRLVNEGQLVKAGEQVAELGRTGAVREMLHFEIRHNGRPVDPLRFLPAR